MKITLGLPLLLLALVINSTRAHAECVNQLNGRTSFKLHQMFSRLLDTNGDGVFTPREYHEAYGGIMNNLGARITTQNQMFDLNRDGVISAFDSEIVKSLLGLVNRRSIETYAFTDLSDRSSIHNCLVAELVYFSKADTNKDGALSTTEKTALRSASFLVAEYLLNSTKPKMECYARHGWVDLNQDQWLDNDEITAAANVYR